MVRSATLVIVVLSLVMAAGASVSSDQAQGARAARFVAEGDFGARSTTNGVLVGMRNATPSAALALGDLKYQDLATEAQWCDYVKARVGSTLSFQRQRSASVAGTVTRSAVRRAHLPVPLAWPTHRGAGVA